jgi:hypothetical protein
MSKLKIGVDLQYMVKYFETFSPVHGVSEDFVKGYKGEVMVLVPVTRVIKDKQAHSTLQDINKLQAIDILPAIKFLLKCPHMRCSFIQIPAPAWRESDIEELHDLNRLIDRRANSMSLLKTISHVTYSITQVEVRITLLETQTDWVGMRPWLAPPDLITFIFDGRAKEDWMDGRPLRRSDSWKDKDEVEMNVKRYLELTGMEDIEEHRWRINAFAQVKEHILEDSTSL